jgi:hypothetical protein
MRMMASVFRTASLEYEAATDREKIAGFFFGVELKLRRKSAQVTGITLRNGGN